MGYFVRMALAASVLAGVGMGHAQQWDATQPKTVKKDDYLNHMSGRCRALNESIRQAYARGLGHETRNGLVQEYQSDCADEEYEARSVVDQQRRDERQHQQEASRDAKLERTRASEQSQALIEQCRESLRIIAVKRARTDLTAGEKSDLQRFEENVRSRCR